MYQASFVLLLFINAFNFRLCYLEKKKKKKLKRTCWLYKKNLFDVFVVKHVSGNTRILIGPDLNLGTRITLTSV